MLCTILVKDVYPMWIVRKWVEVEAETIIKYHQNAAKSARKKHEADVEARMHWRVVAVCHEGNHVRPGVVP